MNFLNRDLVYQMGVKSTPASYSKRVKMPTSVDTAQPTAQITPQSTDQEKDKQQLNQDGFRTTDVVSMSIAHGTHDLYTAFVAPLLPVLIENLSLTRALAGSLSIFTQLPSLIQPFIGHIADRFDLRWAVILAPAVSGILISLIGLPQQYLIIALLLTLAGVSSAALHSVGPVIAGYVSGKRLGLGMSFWMVGGEIGRVFGPILIVTILGTLTISSLPWLMLGGIAASIVLYFRLRNVQGLVPAHSNGLSFMTAAAQMKSLLLPLGILLLGRAFMSSALTTYLPTFLTDEGSNLWFAGVSLSVLQAAGVPGALLSGPISDRIGRRKVMLASLLASPVFMVMFLALKGWYQMPILLLLGFFSISLTPVLMAVVQESCPESRSMANGIFMALSFIIQSITIVVIGIIGDEMGLRIAFYASAFLMLAGAPFVFLMPYKTQGKADQKLSK
jgi:FSR family fosmidomycin resistance protein-like MFS transporter